MSLILVLGAATVVAAVPLFWWAVTGERTSSIATRNLAAGFNGGGDMRQALLAHSAHDRAISPAMDWLARQARRLTPSGMLESLERRVLLAGGPEAWPIARVLGVKLLLGLFGAGLSFLWFVSGPSGGRVVLGAAGTLFAWFVPDILLYNAAEKRQLVIRKALPDTLDQMTISVEAGLAFDGAMARAGRSGVGPLNRELLRTMQDIQAGLSRKEALKGLTERTNVDELRSFVHAVSQADSLGVPIARVLRLQANEQRVKRRQRAEESAMKLPVKIIFPLIMCILPVIFILLMGPAAIRIVDTFSNR
jgi:tight adherence protein C